MPKNNKAHIDVIFMFQCLLQTSNNNLSLKM